MSRLYRPPIPSSVRVQVAERQFYAKFPNGNQVYDLLAPDWTLKRRLQWLLFMLFKEQKFELHHRPALVNRQRRGTGKATVYTPAANDVAHLTYLEEGAHDIETRVRGVGALRSDLSQARYLKKVSRNRETRPKTSRFPKFSSRVKRTTKLKIKPKWPKRSFEGNSR